jgi:hypothetical protein
MFGARHAGSEETAMKSRQTSGPQGFWGEVLLGGLAGLGVPVLLLGVSRRRGLPSNPATVGTLAGLLGALVGGRLARRARGRPAGPGEVREAPREVAQALLELGPHLEERPEPRRGPGGRERYWQEWGASAGAL